MNNQINIHEIAKQKLKVTIRAQLDLVPTKRSVGSV